MDVGRRGRGGGGGGGMGMTYPMHAQTGGRSPKNGQSTTARGVPAGAPTGAKHHHQHHDIFGVQTAAFHAHAKQGPPHGQPHHHQHHPPSHHHQHSPHHGGVSAHGASGSPPPPQPQHHHSHQHTPQARDLRPSVHHGHPSPHAGGTSHIPSPQASHKPAGGQGGTPGGQPAPPQTVLKVAEFRSAGRPLPMLLSATTGAASEQGKRPTMEDVHEAHQGLMDKVSLYFVCDGHSGRQTADLAAQLLPQLLRDIPMKDLQTKTAQSLAEWFVKVDRAIFKNMKRLRKREGGAAAVAAVTIGNELFIANLGDSRAVLCDGGHSIALTKDHKPSDQSEAMRVVQSGGYIALGRVGGSLAITRAFGDFELKGWERVLESTSLPVSNVPDISHISLTSTCEFLILACDGVWDVIKCQDAVSICREHMAKGPTKMAQALARASLEQGSMDNITVLVIVFSTGEEGHAKETHHHHRDVHAHGARGHHGGSRSPPPGTHAPASSIPTRGGASAHHGGAGHHNGPHHLNPNRTNIRVTPGHGGNMSHTTPPPGNPQQPQLWASRMPGAAMPF